MARLGKLGRCARKNARHMRAVLSWFGEVPKDTEFGKGYFRWGDLSRVQTGCPRRPHSCPGWRGGVPIPPLPRCSTIRSPAWRKGMESRVGIDIPRYEHLAPIPLHWEHSLNVRLRDAGSRYSCLTSGQYLRSALRMILLKVRDGTPPKVACLHRNPIANSCDPVSPQNRQGMLTPHCPSRTGHTYQGVVVLPYENTKPWSRKTAHADWGSLARDEDE